MSPRGDAAWYRDLPNWSKVLLQLGFAGVIGLLFILDSRDRSGQLREMQAETINQARDDRQMFREELKMQREELKAAVDQMKRAIDNLSSHQQKMKSELDDLKFPLPKPREK